MCCHYETGLSLLFEGLEKDLLSDWYWIINKMISGFNNNCMYINDKNMNLMKKKSI